MADASTAQAPGIDPSLAGGVSQAAGGLNPSDLEEMLRESVPFLSGGADAASPAVGAAAFSWGGYIQAIAILCLLLAGLWFLLWLMRRFGKFNFMPKPGALPKGALAMEAQMPLGPRKGLMVVRFLNKRVLLGVTDQRITFLSEERAEHDSQNADFQKIMENANQRDAAAGTGGGRPDSLA